MIVCSCNLITSKDIAEAVSEIRSNDPFVAITPALIYRYLGKRPVRQLPAARRLVSQHADGYRTVMHERWRDGPSDSRSLGFPLSLRSANPFGSPLVNGPPFRRNEPQSFGSM